MIFDNGITVIMVHFLQLSSTFSISKLKPFGVKLTNVDLNSPEQRETMRNLLFENGVPIISANRAKAGNRLIYDDESFVQLRELFRKS